MYQFNQDLFLWGGVNFQTKALAFYVITRSSVFEIIEKHVKTIWALEFFNLFDMLKLGSSLFGQHTFFTSFIQRPSLMTFRVNVSTLVWCWLSHAL